MSKPRSPTRSAESRRLAGAWAVVFPSPRCCSSGRPTTAGRPTSRSSSAPGSTPLVSRRRSWRTGSEPASSSTEAASCRLLVMSGGDGADGFNEARVMRDTAVAAGVDPAAILVDPAGDSTEATVAERRRCSRPDGGRTWDSSMVRAVSQAYHLPRVQLAFATAGIDVLTVPGGRRRADRRDAAPDRPRGARVLGLLPPDQCRVGWRP